MANQEDGNGLLDPKFIIDLVQVVVVGLALALDMTDIWTGPTWLSENIGSLTFVAVCLLIVSAFLERHTILKDIEENANRSFRELSSQQLALSEQLKRCNRLGL